jgi:hypothetical protein
MPNIAAFIKELLSEDKYSAAYNERIEQRISYMNNAQLHGMRNYLVTASKDCKSDLWFNANKEILFKIETALNHRIDEEKMEQKMVDEYYLKEQHAKNALLAKQEEEKRVKQMIKEQALISAEKDIRDQEFKRQSVERIELMKVIQEKESKRNSWFLKIFVVTVVCIIIVSITIKATVLLIMTLSIVFSIALLGIWKVFQFTSVHPMVVTEEKLQDAIHTKAELLIKRKFEELDLKEKMFLEKLKNDELEKKKLKREKKRKLNFEIEFNEQKIQEQKRLIEETNYKNNNIAFQSDSTTNNNTINNNKDNNIEKNNNENNNNNNNKNDKRCEFSKITELLTVEEV